MTCLQPQHKTLDVRLEHQVLFITLNNPSFGNSFGPEQATQLVESLRSHPEIKALVWQSTPGAPFCAGGNLKFYSELESREMGINANRQISDALYLLASASYPSIALVTGDCLGGGMELLSCFDKVMAVPHCRFGFWQRRIGLIFGWGGGRRWLKRLNPHTLELLSLEARSLSSQEALKLGLIDQIVPDFQIRHQAQTWLSQHLKWPQSPVAALKNFAPDKEQSSFESLWMNAEHEMVLKKFQNKRRN